MCDHQSHTVVRFYCQVGTSYYQSINQCIGLTSCRLSSAASLVSDSDMRYVLYTGK